MLGITIAFWLGVFFGTWSLVLFVYRGWKCFQWGWNNKTPPPDKYNFSMPFLVTAACWIVVIAIVATT